MKAHNIFGVKFLIAHNLCIHVLKLVPMTDPLTAFVQLAFNAMQISLFPSDKQLISIEI